MSVEGQVELESYKLAKYVSTIPCYICRGPNHRDAERCRHCFAPMALAYQAKAQRVQPKILAVLGAAGAGKTAYLGLLTDILSRQSHGLQLLARGAFSVSLQQETTASLARCEFPPPTSADPEVWHWVHCQLLRGDGRKPQELILPDVCGGVLFKEADHPASDPIVRPMLTQAAAALILVDAPEAACGGNQADFSTLKMLTYLHELDPLAKQSWRQRPIAIVFTKTDACDAAADDPTAFAREHLSGVWRMCQDRKTPTGFFATSVAAGCISRVGRGGRRTTVPLRVEPRGIVEPFRSLVDQIA